MPATSDNPFAANARTVPVPGGAVRFDAEVIATPGRDWFDAQAWQERGARVTPIGTGRGSAWSIDCADLQGVLRHYRRGGAVRRLLGDRYWFRGAARTRAFREFDLLALLHHEGYAVPRPLAVQYLRSGLWYRADLLTQRIPGARTLDERLQGRERVDWPALGRAIARLHRRGVWHADLNAHNVLIDEAARFWIVDFDRARVRTRAGAWQRANLDRLSRSLRKLGHAGLLQTAWPQLALGYAEAIA